MKWIKFKNVICLSNETFSFASSIFLYFFFFKVIQFWRMLSQNECFARIEIQLKEKNVDAEIHKKNPRAKVRAHVFV